MLLHNKSFKTLVVDDHPIIIEGYSNVLATINEFSLHITSATDCDDAIGKLKKPKDLVLLDLQLPASKDGKFIAGDDIGLWLRKKAPKTKIIVLTAIEDAQRVQSIIKKIKPEGFAIKSDLSSIDLIEATKIVLNGAIYYSKTIKKIIDNNNNNNNNINGNLIDDIDRKILYHLSMGETNKSIAKTLSFSLRAIEDRKARLKDILGIHKNEDTNLIKEAKRKNLI